MKFKVVFLICCICFSLTVFCSAAQDYMSYFWKYTEAASSGDPEKICNAVDALDKALPNPCDLKEHNTMIWAVLRAAKEYEISGNYDKALYYYQKFVKYAQWLQENDNQDHSENIKFTNAAINTLSLTPELYIATSQPADAVYYGAKHEPEYGVFNGSCDVYDSDHENAYLLYVRFFDETVKAFDYLIPQDAEYLMIAWNLPNENKSDLERVLSSDYDEYIISNLKYIATLEHKVLLRFGAEVNCWNIPADKAQREEFIDTFKAAFCKISEYAKQYAPNAAMVYSPNDVSNMYVTPQDLYPGDEYVDWVGMSTYYLLDSSASFMPANQADAYYFRGLYDNPMAKIRSIVEAFGDRKPILISECGFGYAEQDGQNIDHAKQKLNEFFTYLNMVYPQIKGVLYFDTDFERKYRLSNAPELERVYLDAKEQNAGIQAMLDKTDIGYTRFSGFEGDASVLDLYAYAKYPSANKTDVAYYLNEKELSSQKEIPYKLSLDASSLAEGKYTLTMKVSCGNFVKNYDYVFYIDSKKILQNPPAPLPFTDVSPDDWFYSDVKTAYRNGLINGKGNIYAPDDNMTYAEAIKIASCMHQLYYDKKVTLKNGSVNWYDTYIEYAYDNSIITQSVSGMENEFITRKEFVRIFHASFPKEEYTPINTITDNAIPDVPYSNDIYSPLIYDFYRAGILTGSDGGKFNPESNIKRSEVAAILTRMFDKSERKAVEL